MATALVEATLLKQNIRHRVLHCARSKRQVEAGERPSVEYFLVDDLGIQVLLRFVCVVRQGGEPVHGGEYVQRAISAQVAFGPQDGKSHCLSDDGRHAEVRQAGRRMSISFFMGRSPYGVSVLLTSPLDGLAACTAVPRLRLVAVVACGPLRVDVRPIFVHGVF